MNRRSALLALAAAAAAALPATAHAEPVYAGFTCGFAAVRQNSVTGQATFVGTVFNYFYAGDTKSGPASSVFIECSVRVNGVTAAAASSNTAGPAGLLPPTPVTFTAASTDVIEACTLVRAQDGNGQTIYELQRCNEATSAEAGGEEGAEAEAEPWDREAGTG